MQQYQDLIDWCFTARQHKICQFVPIYQWGLLAQAFEDNQRGTYKKHTIPTPFQYQEQQQQQQKFGAV